MFSKKIKDPQIETTIAVLTSEVVQELITAFDNKRELDISFLMFQARLMSKYAKILNGEDIKRIEEKILTKEEREEKIQAVIKSNHSHAADAKRREEQSKKI